MEYYGGELPSPQKYDPTKMVELDSNHPPAYELPGGKRDSDLNPSPMVGTEGVHVAGSVGVQERQGTQEMNNYNHRGYTAGIGEERDSERGYNA